MIRVLIVDDEPLARERLRTLCEDEADLLVVGDCGDGRAAARAIENERPDLMFLDVQMPEQDGFALLEFLLNFLLGNQSGTNVRNGARLRVK